MQYASAGVCSRRTTGKIFKLIDPINFKSLIQDRICSASLLFHHAKTNFEKAEIRAFTSSILINELSFLFCSGKEKANCISPQNFVQVRQSGLARFRDLLSPFIRKTISFYWKFKALSCVFSFAIVYGNQ